MKKAGIFTGLLLVVCMCMIGMAVYPSCVSEAAEPDEENKIILDYAAYQQRFEQIQTIEDIRTKGYQVIEKHVFDVPLVTVADATNEEGERIPTEVTRPENIYRIGEEDAVAQQEVPTFRFYTAIDSTCHRAAVFLADEEGTIIYKNNQLECNYGVRGSLTQPITDMVSVAFMDVNSDERMDIILIAGCVNESGDYAGKQYKIGEVLFQSGDKDLSREAPSFYRDWRVNDKLNRFGMNKSAKCILSFVRDGCSTEFLYTATTEEELLTNGFRVYEEQSYWRDYEKLGRLKVLPGVFPIADYDIFMVYMINEQGNIVWSFQPMGDMDNLYSLKGMSGKDMDGDGMKDLVIWAQYSKEGEPGELIVENHCAIYYQRTGGFDTDTDFVNSYRFTGQENMEELLKEIRAYWGWSAEETENASLKVADQIE